MSILYSSQFRLVDSSRSFAAIMLFKNTKKQMQFENIVQVDVILDLKMYGIHL